MVLDKLQFQRQMDYSATLHALITLRNSGILSSKDFSKAKDIIARKYSPLIQPNS